MSDVELPLIAPKEDPRASAGIARSKSLGGLAGFALAAFASYSHEPMFTVAERALGRRHRRLPRRLGRRPDRLAAHHAR